MFLLPLKYQYSPIQHASASTNRASSQRFASRVLIFNGLFSKSGQTTDAFSMWTKEQWN